MSIDTYVGGFYSNLIYFLSGSTVVGIIAHAVNTFPTPKSRMGQWLLGVIQYAVGQRISGMNTFQGLQSVVTSKPENGK